MSSPKKTIAQYEAEAIRMPSGCLVHPSSCAARRCYLLRHPDADRKLLVCHKCDNPACIEDNHHFLGTSRDNVKDAVAKGRHSCFANVKKAQAKSPFRTAKWRKGLSDRVKGWTARGEQHGNSKFTEDDVRSIRKSKLPTRQIARTFGVSHSTIGRMRRRITWGHVS
jgi:hypothetical protein